MKQDSVAFSEGQIQTMKMYNSNKRIRFSLELEDLLCKYQDVVDSDSNYLFKKLRENIRKELNINKGDN